MAASCDFFIAGLSANSTVDKVSFFSSAVKFSIVYGTRATSIERERVSICIIMKEDVVMADCKQDMV